MVSFHGRVAPSEAHRGEKRSTQNHSFQPPISKVVETRQTIDLGAAQIDDQDTYRALK
jgi:hypothetical protein